MLKQGETTSCDSLEFQALVSHSARLGNDPLQIQGAGGNTSIKQGDVMWIKASGRWLMHATEQNLFVPVNREPLLQALAVGDSRAEKSVDFIVDELNPEGLRPSIETSLHAILIPRVVIHVHCVDTIAIAIQQDAAVQLDTLLSDFSWVFIPYVRPGVPLSNSIASRITAETNVLVLGNHGLVVAADSVDDCVALLERVRLAMRQEPRNPVYSKTSPADDAHARASEALISAASLERVLRGSDYVSAQPVAAHAIAFDKVGLEVAAGGSLYPDHVIFLGQGIAIADAGEDAVSVGRRYSLQGVATPVSIVFPGLGVAILGSATEGQIAMVRCLSDVCCRVPAGAAISYFDEHQNDELLNWEAEQYRQTLRQDSA